MIKNVEFKNIRGFGEINTKFDFNLKPNRPVFCVAPNGFGKSSIAAAFNSLKNKNRIDVEKKNYHKGNDGLTSEIVLQYDDDLLIANNTKNEIIKEFDIKVINNTVYPNVRRKKLESGFTVETGELKVQDVIIIKKIPEKRIFDYYKISEIRKIINSKTNTWENLNVLLEDKRLFFKLTPFLSPFEKIRTFKKVDDFVKINETLSLANISKIETEEFILLRDELINLTKKDLIDASLICIQIIYFYKSDVPRFKETISYYKYLLDKEYIDSFFYGKTWKTLKPKEIDVRDRKTKKIIYKSYGTEFPNADEVSNGERDVVVFLSSLLQSFINLEAKKKNFILIIDEVFDYLDDANLIIVQHFINEFIQKCKDCNIYIYPILLTHLDPYYFNTYSFKKFDVVYLNKWKQQKDINVENFVILRNNANRKSDEGNSVYNKISKHFIHFSPIECVLDMEEVRKCLKEEKCQSNNGLKELIDSKKFKLACLQSLENYTNKKSNFEPISVCIALRVIIEEIVYNMLKEEFKEEFLDQNETLKKLNFAKKHIKLSGDYFLLSSIYNETLHIKNEQDNNSRLFLKLNNGFIKGMIENIWNNYKRISK